MRGPSVATGAPVLSFKAPGAPQTQGSMRVVGGRVFHENAKLENWRRVVNMSAVAAAREAGVDLPLDGPLVVEAEFLLPRPRTVRRLLPCVKPDLDKLMRAVGDALCPSRGVRAIVEDSRIVEWQAVKRYAGPGQVPGVKVRIRRAGEDGPAPAVRGLS